MAAVEDAEAITLEAEIGRARAAISKAVVVGNLTADPVSKALEAMSITLAAQLALHRASTRHLREVSDRLDAHVAASLALAETELRAKKADMIATLTPQLAGMVQDVVRGRLWTIKLRAIAICTAAIGILVIAVGVGGYSGGYRDGLPSPRRRRESPEHNSGGIVARRQPARYRRDGRDQSNV